MSNRTELSRIPHLKSRVLAQTMGMVYLQAPEATVIELQIYNNVLMSLLASMELRGIESEGSGMIHRPEEVLVRD